MITKTIQWLNENPNEWHPQCSRRYLALVHHDVIVSVIGIPDTGLYSVELNSIVMGSEEIVALKGAERHTATVQWLYENQAWLQDGVVFHNDHRIVVSIEQLRPDTVFRIRVRVAMKADDCCDLNPLSELGVTAGNDDEPSLLIETTAELASHGGSDIFGSYCYQCYHHVGESDDCNVSVCPTNSKDDEELLEDGWMKISHADGSEEWFPPRDEDDYLDMTDDEFEAYLREAEDEMIDYAKSLQSLLAPANLWRAGIRGRRNIALSRGAYFFVKTWYEPSNKGGAA